jgi:hypothetical protein
MQRYQSGKHIQTRRNVEAVYHALCDRLKNDRDAEAAAGTRFSGAGASSNEGVRECVGRQLCLLFCFSSPSPCGVVGRERGSGCSQLCRRFMPSSGIGASTMVSSSKAGWRRSAVAGGSTLGEYIGSEVSCGRAESASFGEREREDVLGRGEASKLEAL